MAWPSFSTSPRNYLVTLSVTVLILALGAFWVAKVRNIQRIKREIAQLETRLSEGQELWKKYPPLTPVERRDLQRAQDRLFHMLPRDKEIPSLLQEISRLARQHQLIDVSFSTGNGVAPGASPQPTSGSAAPAVVVPQKAPSVSPASQEKSGPIASVLIKASFAGDYREIAYFLEALRALPRLVTVQSLKVQRGVPLLHAELLLHAYYQEGALPGVGK